MDAINLPKLHMEGYVIVNPNTGEFSSGGCDVKFKKKGKIWRTLGHVKSHIIMLIELCENHSKYTTDLNWSTLRLYKGCKVYEIGQQKEVLDVWEYAKETAQKRINESKYKSSKNWKVIE